MILCAFSNLTIVEEEIEVDVEPEETEEAGGDEVKGQEGNDEAGNAGRDGAEGHAGAAEAVDRSSKKVAAGTGEGKEGHAEGGDAAAADGVEGGESEKITPPPPKKKLVKVKRIETLHKTTVYMSLDRMTAEMHENPTVFFVRAFDGTVPNILDSSDLWCCFCHG